MTSLSDLRRRAPWLDPSLLLVGAVAAVYAPLLVGKVTFHRDIGRLMWPRRFLLHAALVEGRLPLWTSGLGLGRSSFAEPQVGLFYPPALLFAMGPTPWMLTLFSFLHLLWGGFGITALARRLAAGAAPAVVAGLAWSLGGVATSEWTAGYRMLAASWLPWCALGFVCAADRSRGQGGPVLGAAAGVAAPVAMALLLGEAFVAFIAAGFGLCLGLARLGPAEAGAGRQRRLARFLAASAAGLAVALACGAVALLPAVKLSPGTERAAPLAREVAELWSVHPLRLIELGAPGVFASLFERAPGSPLVRDLLDGAPLMLSIYLGGAVLALASVAIGPGRRPALVLLALAVLALGLALGRHTPLHAAFRTLVPPLAYMRYPEKYLVVVAAATALLAALGTERLLSGAGRPIARLVVIAALPVVLLACAGLFPAELRSPLRRGALHGALAASAVVILLVIRARAPRTVPTVLVVAVAAVDLASAALPVRRFGSASLLDARPPAAAILLSDHARSGAVFPPRLFRAPAVTETVARSATLPPELRSLATLRDNLSIPLGIGIFPGYDASMPIVLLDLAREAARGRIDVLRLFAVGYALLPTDGSEDGARAAGLEPLGDPVPGARLFRVSRSLSRAYVAGASEVVDDVTARASLLAADVVSGRRILLGTDQAGAVAHDGPAVGRCRIRRFEETRVEASCESTVLGWAVFVEQHEPGWTATVDGAPAPVLRANLVARAVPLPAGRHDIVLEYRPPDLLPAGVVSLAGVAALVAMAAFARRRPSERASAATG